jgi:transmembrane sensor
MHGTGVGVRDSVTLSDGTRIVIGPLSSVTIPADYGVNSRSVLVRGDAWFDVVHDERKPFTVHAGNAAIVDVGTRFAVSSDAAAGVSVSVTEGAVSLSQLNSPAGQGVILQAGDNGRLEPDGRVVSGRGKATADDLAWRDGRLVFREAELAEVAGSMRKWYGIEMKIADKSLNNRHLTATFNGESADRVLETIKLALGAEIERHGDTAIVRLPKGKN